MTETARLRLPEIAAAQAQKHVTHNEALTALDTLVQLSVLDKDLAAPPGSPAEGDCYIVASGATGDWTGWDDRVARYEDGAWRSHLPGEGDGIGWRAWVQDEETLYVLRDTGWAAFSGGGGGGAVVPPQGRLTLTSATPVLTSAITAATTVYYTPFLGRSVPLYGGAVWSNNALDELGLALDSDSGHAGYHQAGRNFDLFVFDDAGTKRLGSGPAWSDDTTRADALTRLDGILVNDAPIGLRHGAASDDVLTVPANRATYLGTFRASADGQTEFSFGGYGSGGVEARLYVWNCYNRRQVGAAVHDTDNTWTLAASAIRAANNSTANRVSFVSGQAEDSYDAAYYVGGLAGVSGQVAAGVGFDSTTAFSGSILRSNLTGGIVLLTGRYATPALGHHYFQAMEAAQIAGTATFAGDGGVPAYGQNGLHFSGAM